MSKSGEHNAAVEIALRALAAGVNDQAELMVRVESLIMGLLLYNVMYLGLKPRTSSNLMEDAMQRATERYLADLHKHPPR